MARNWVQKQKPIPKSAEKSNLANGGKSFHNRESGVLGCKHYQRGAKLYASCCDKWFACRFCHDECSDHSVVRFRLWLNLEVLQRL